MPTLDAEATRPLVRDLVHFDTQRAPRGLDLTVGALFRVTGAGRLDFGGSEWAAAPREAIAPQQAHPDDDYGWWRLDPGTYLLRYNETLALDPKHHARLFPLPRLLAAGASHPAFVVEGTPDPMETLCTVGTGGCRIKENSRVSRLEVVEAA